MQHDEYAQKSLSDEGQHNGLYWKAPDGEASEPHRAAGSVGCRGGRSQDQGAPTPLSRLLLSHPHAPGQRCPGRREELHREGGKMTEGFALVAYPAEYKSSGVMTFIVDRGWRGLSEGSRQEDRVSRQIHEGIQPRFHLAKGRRRTRTNRQRSKSPIRPPAFVGAGFTPSLDPARQPKRRLLDTLAIARDEVQLQIAWDKASVSADPTMALPNRGHRAPGCWHRGPAVGIRRGRGRSSFRRLLRPLETLPG